MMPPSREYHCCERYGTAFKTGKADRIYCYSRSTVQCPALVPLPDCCHFIASPIRSRPNMDFFSCSSPVQEAAGTQFPQLLHFFCPSIFGNTMIKAGLLLALFGGSGHHGGAGGGPQRRTSIHLLMCGDPGLGKSQLLQVCFAQQASFSPILP